MLRDTGSAENMAAFEQLQTVGTEVARKTHFAVKDSGVKALLLLDCIMDQDLGHEFL